MAPSVTQKPRFDCTIRERLSLADGYALTERRKIPNERRKVRQARLRRKTSDEKLAFR
jgi:hypothetical protein